MKIAITFKSPDAVYDAVSEAATEFVDNIEADLDSAQIEALRDSQIEKHMEALKPWVEYGECVTVEFDLDAESAEVTKL